MRSGAHNLRNKILAFALIALLAPKIMLTSDDSVDMLVYTDPESGALTLYDPRRRVSTPLLEDFESFKFSFNVDGRIAFSSNHEGHSEVRPSFWTVAIRSRKTEKNWEIIGNGTAKKTDIQRGI